ncbi:MAG: hypothetical protein CM15mV139_010 [Caudoviricetes sp.]|nr:MAG: hypothetical protein CM15mV139_010 [Caudoviricetes sp.]
MKKGWQVESRFFLKKLVGILVKIQLKVHVLSNNLISFWNF